METASSTSAMMRRAGGGWETDGQAAENTDGEEGEGLGFKRSRRDPPLLVGSVLGLVDQALDLLLRDIEAKQKQVDQCKERIPELERAPAFALAHAHRQLRLKVRAEEDEPVFATTVGESVESRVQAALQKAGRARRPACSA